MENGIAQDYKSPKLHNYRLSEIHIIAIYSTCPCATILDIKFVQKVWRNDSFVSYSSHVAAMRTLPPPVLPDHLFPDNYGFNKPQVVMVKRWSWYETTCGACWSGYETKPQVVWNWSW